MLRRRGYALTPARLAAVCLGGPLPESEVRWAVGADPDLQMAEGLVVERVASCAVPVRLLKPLGYTPLDHLCE